MKLIDLTNQRFERLVVLERDFETQQLKKSKEVFWKCQCDCGNIISVRGHDLRQNKIKSCGCLKKENAKNINYKDLTGQRFGKLQVLYQCDFLLDNHTVWHCRCDCGNEKDIMGRTLLAKKAQSCGCLKSSGEFLITQILLSLNIPFETQKTFETCRDKNLLKFDFYLPYQNILIEYNGEQHYKSIEIFGGEERFKQQIQHDSLKKEWCKNNNIPLIIISYKEYKLLNKDYLYNLIQEAIKC